MPRLIVGGEKKSCIILKRSYWGNSIFYALKRGRFVLMKQSEVGMKMRDLKNALCRYIQLIKGSEKTNCNSAVWQVRRVLGYTTGFVLFYAPFALFHRSMAYLLDVKSSLTIHSFCLRIPIAHLLDGKVFHLNLPAISLLILIAAAFFLGPLFCGRLCPAGAFSEYLSMPVPEKYKISWMDYVPVIPIRYGFFLGFILSSLWGGRLACTYCNFYSFDLLINYISFGRITALSSSMLLTLIFWIVILGIFTKGGRGYCCFFCPVGTLQSLIYALGKRILPLQGTLRIKKMDCHGCGVCVSQCPVNAIRINEDRIAEKNMYICILCMNCINKCPYGVISYRIGGNEAAANEQKF